MARRWLDAVALGISMVAAGGEWCEDSSSLFQMNPLMLPEKSEEATLSASKPLAISMFGFGGTAVLEKKEVPASFTEFVLSIPARYSHIAYDVKYNNFAEELITFPMRKPLTFNLLMATCKTWLADMVVQLGESRATSSGIDWRRSLAFAVFGFFYVGLVQWVMYVTVMTDLFPHAIAFANEPLSLKLHNLPGQIDLIKQVAMDNFVFAVMIYFPAFYIVKELVNGSRSPFVEALRTYKENFRADNCASISFWIPGDCVAFAAPIFLRLPLDHTVSFIWTMYLSFKRGRDSSGTQPKEP